MARKIIVGFTLITITACALIFVGTRGVWKGITNRTHVATLTQRIASFDIPKGFQTDYAVDILDYTIAAYKSTDERSHIVFLQAPPGVIPDEQVMAGYITDDEFDTAWQSEIPISTTSQLLRDRPTTITVTDRINGQGELYRSLNVIFEGRNGPTLLVINQPVTDWDETAIAAFIASIH